MSEQAKSRFIHIVFFWLHENTPPEAKRQLIDDCKQYLGTVESVKTLAVGIPAGTPRHVVDNSYDVCIVVEFENKEGHDAYQSAPKHLEFIDRNKKYWRLVQVYDTVTQ